MIKEVIGMFMTVKGIYKNGKVELLETPTVLKESRVLVTFIPEEALPTAKRPQALHGVWRGLFPEDLDLDAALKEIRSEWLKEWEEGSDE